MYHSFIKVDQGHHVPYIYLLGVLYSKACMKQNSMTSKFDNLRKRLMQTCFDFDRNVINASVTI